MPQKIKLEDGTETEVYTIDEVEARAKEEAAKAAEKAEAEKLELETRTAEEREEIESKLLETEEKLRKAEEKELNFKNLRDKTDKTEAEREQNKKEIEELRKTVSAIQQQPLVAAKEEFVKKNIAGDKDLQEKFDLFFEKFGKGATTMVDLNAALVAAYAAATDGKPVPQAVDRTHVNENFAGFDDPGRESEASQEFGKMLGLTPDDKKKYGGVIRTGSVPLTANTHPSMQPKE